MSLLQKKIRNLNGLDQKGVTDISKSSYKSYNEILLSSSRYKYLFEDASEEIVTVILPNSIDYLEAMLACLLTGNIFNPIPFFTSDNELERIFNYVNPKVVITSRDITSGLKKHRLIINPNELDKHLMFESEFGLECQGDDIAALYYSSGTTGNPKGVMYSHDNIYYLIESINRGFGFDHKTSHFSVLPFGHTASINYNIFPCFFTGAPLVIAESFSNIAHNFFKILSDNKISYVQVVPTIVYMLLKINYKLDDIDLSRLMFVGCGSSTLPLESQIEFEKKFGIRIGNLYGLSETGPTHIDDPRSKNWSPGTIGVPLDVNECSITKDGEILIKGRNVFSGYFKNEGLYKKVVKNGWFYTGDLVDYQNDKFIYKDRSKDLIIKGGINIVPAEVEEVLYMNKEVLEAAVIGIFNEVHGEEIVAAVSLRNPNPNKDEIKLNLYNLLRDNLSSYKHPIDIFFFDSIPKTHSGKLKRREVKRIIEHEYT